MAHGADKAPRTRAGHLGDRRVFRAPRKPELRGKETLLRTSQPDLQGEVGRERREAASPHSNEETGCLELRVSDSCLLSS